MDSEIWGVDENGEFTYKTNDTTLDIETRNKYQGTAKHQEWIESFYKQHELANSCPEMYNTSPLMDWEEENFKHIDVLTPYQHEMCPDCGERLVWSGAISDDTYEFKCVEFDCVKCRKAWEKQYPEGEWDSFTWDSLRELIDDLWYGDARTQMDDMI
jgi:hypothetical protein